MRFGLASSLSRKSGSRYASGCCDIRANLPQNAMIPPPPHRSCRRMLVTIRISGAVAVAVLLTFAAAAQQPATTPSIHAKASRRLIIKNAMVIYGNAKPPYGPVDIVVQDGLISYIGTTTEDACNTHARATH